ncbi:IS200/IS605-like element ISCbt2 family transposase [Clostridium botulinum C]|uniref:IS200/IS605-like element ISCbt2 family transposase n=2 Tax=Clostridium botulinum TaxID=1491 RepID=A0A9Q4TP08_CLOBO|nr:MULTISPECIES: IS200/IS605-like element ISCbt2 family transposase [Clostridium]YP_398612.1 transposase [Clostridium phage c-st]MCD3196093.1 IS200/IS605-like element ISCbt2 family transposase [Clostridium botulinum C]MCD3200303.1 IS200/IS605-like element ISCbt2 family transposase [Clostridium botulinum C]MCD3206949.1 IS200/IS605-like element ISCbt2 family transposase [Clostridium botulinum C]MCD3207535.1 IS200/IS605-like element ISCbt2 family transposase [Clostridium botulinum C]MCD3216898.1
MKHYRKNNKYYSSSHLVYRCCYHVVFCPKYRRSILLGNVTNRLKEICYEIAKTHDFLIEEIETDKDHVHMIINCNPRYGVIKCVQLIKGISGYKLFEEFPFIKKRYLWGGKFWSRSTFVATVGSVSLDIVKRYIENQGK